MKLRLKAQGLAVAVIVFIFGGILAGGALGYWKTTASKVPAQFTSGEYVGQYDPADIKGSYSFKNISDSFGIPVEILSEAFGLDEKEDAGAFQCKTLETRYEALKDKGYEIGTDSVRVFVALYKGLPVELAGTFIPKEAYGILERDANLTSEQEEYFSSHIVELRVAEGQQSAEAAMEAVEASPAANESKTTDNTVNVPQDSVNDRQVRGKTTFKELLDWGLTKGEVEGVISGDMPDTATTIKDYCTEKSIEFSGIKVELQAIIDRKK